jgi:hypothetical protein
VGKKKNPPCFDVCHARPSHRTTQPVSHTDAQGTALLLACLRTSTSTQQPNACFAPGSAVCSPHRFRVREHVCGPRAAPRPRPAQP